MKKTKKSATRNVIVFVLIAAVIVALFAFLLNKKTEDREAVSTVGSTVVRELLAKNILGNYPPTPKEVVKLYSDFTMCFYNEEFDENELAALAMKSRQLLDDELVDGQTDADYLNELKGIINAFGNENRTISSYSVSSAADVEYDTMDGYEWARLQCYYSMRIGKGITPVHETFLLRKDSTGHWKIYGWQLAEEEDEE